MLGLSKSFAIVLIISIIFSIGLRDTNPLVGLEILGGYIILKIVWNVLTKKKWMRKKENTLENIWGNITKLKKERIILHSIAKNQRQKKDIKNMK